MKSFIKICFVITTALISSCSSSLVYSPSINLPNQPLKEKEIDLIGGFELLPETRQKAIQGNPTTMGLNGQVSYGFSDKFNMSLKGWLDIENRLNSTRSGFALNGQFINQISSDSRTILLPRIGIALGGNTISGYGFGASFIYQKNFIQNFSWYGGIGFLWGFKNLEKEVNSLNERNLPMGIGIIGNLGLSWQFYNKLRLNLELSPVYQVNIFDKNSQLLLSPSISIGYTID